MTPQLKQLESTHGSKYFLIEEDLPGVGWYLKVFENGQCVFDYLQGSLEAVIKQAEEQYAVPSSGWKEK